MTIPKDYNYGLNDHTLALSKGASNKLTRSQKKWIHHLITYLPSHTTPHKMLSLILSSLKPSKDKGFTSINNSQITHNISLLDKKNFSVIQKSISNIEVMILRGSSLIRDALFTSDPQVDPVSLKAQNYPSFSDALSKMAMKGLKETLIQKNKIAIYCSHLFGMTISAGLQRHRAEKSGKGILDALQEWIIPAQLAPAKTSSREGPVKPKKDGIFSKGGYSCISTEIERSFMKKVLKKGSFTPEEKKQIKRYVRGLNRSFDFNLAIHQGIWLESKEVKLNKALKGITSEIMNTVKTLPDQESVYLDVGHYHHAMRLSITKDQNNIRLTLQDSSGGLDRATILNSPLGIFKLMVYELGVGVRRCAYNISVPEEEFHVKGHEYLTGILKINSDWAHKKEKKARKEAQMEAKGAMFAKIAQLQLLESKWAKTINAFTSIAPEKAQMTESFQSQQNMGNCYAKRLQSNQIQEFGKPLYKKVRQVFMQVGLGSLLFKLKKEKVLPFKSIKALKAMGDRLLPLDELHKVQNRLLKIGDLSKMKKNDWKAVVQFYRHQMELMKVERLDETDLEVTPVSSLPSMISLPVLEQARVINSYNILREKNRKIGLPVNGQLLIVDQIKFFQLLEQNKEALQSEKIHRLLTFLNRPNVLDPEAKEAFGNLSK